LAVIAIFNWHRLFRGDRRKTLYTVLQTGAALGFLLGKYFWIGGTLAVNTFFMAVGFFAGLFTYHNLERSDGQLLVAIYFIVCILIITASVVSSSVRRVVSVVAFAFSS